MGPVTKADLLRWCRIPAAELPRHPELRTKFRVVRDSAEMGQLMAEELVSLIEMNNKQGLPTRAIIPCGPSCWYAPYTRLVNARNVTLRNFTVFHMDECLDWQGAAITREPSLQLPYFHGKTFLRRNQSRTASTPDPEVLVVALDRGARERGNRCRSH